MSLEPIPLDRKSSSLRERKHESSESLGSVARWRGSNSHHHNHRSHEFSRAADYRRPAGHGRQGSWQLFPEESGHEHMLSRSCDRKLEEDNWRPSVSRGDGKYGRCNKESREAFSQREWRGRSWETTNNSLNMSRRQTDVSNDRKSVDDMLTYSSHPNHNVVNTWEQHHMKDHRDKIGDVNRFGTSQRCDRDDSLGTIDWKPLKWTRSGCLSSRDSGFSRSSGMRSLGGTNSKGSCEGKVGLQQKTATAAESNSGEAAICRTSSAPSEETNSRKKSRLNWGEGLAKFERKKVEGPEVTSNKDGPVSPPSNMELSNFLTPSLVDKSPKVSGLPGCASPATPSSAACSSSPEGADDKLLGKAANVDIDVGNLSSSPGHGSQNHMQMFSFNLENVDIDSLISLGSSLVELLPKADGLSSVDYSLLCSTRMNKLLILKADISKVLELTEAEIDLLENELRSLKSNSEGRFPCSAAVVCNGKSCYEHIEGSDKVARYESLEIVSSDDLNVEKRPIVETMPLSANLLDLHDNCQEDHIDSRGPVRFKVVEPLPTISGVSACDVERNGNCSEGLDRIQSTAIQCLIPCTNRHAANVSAIGDSNSSLEAKDGVNAKSSASFYPSTGDILHDTVISCNKKSAKASCEVFANLLPEKCCKNDNIGASSGSCSLNATFIMEKFAEKRRLARLKEKVITLKFKALHHMWKEDMRLLSLRKHRPKSYKKLELELRTTSNSHQKKRSSIPFRFPFPGNQLRLVPTSEMIKYTSQLLSESKHEIYRSTLKMPALILDQNDKINSMFLSSNGLVEDPVSIEKERDMINPWTSEEKEIFLEKFAVFGKDFRKIATFLDHKTTADCVVFYYKNHKSDCFEKILKKDGDKPGKFCIAKTASCIKWNSEVNASSLDILSAASVVADDIASNRKMRSGRRSLWRGYGSKVISRGDNITTDRPDSFDDLRDERETVAADVLTSISGCVLSEAATSCITSSANPVKGKRIRNRVKAGSLCKQPLMPAIIQNDNDTCSDESCGEADLTDWSDVEMTAFLHALSSFGKDFAMIAQCVRTRSQYQCKVLFSKTHKRIGLDLMGPKPENVGSLVNDVDGGRSDPDNACILESGSVNGSDTSGTKAGVDQPASEKNVCHGESNPVGPGNLSADLDQIEETNGKVDNINVNMVSDDCVIGGESKLDSDDNVGVLYGSDRSGSGLDQRAIIMSDSTKIGKDESSGGGAAVELVSAMETIEPCNTNSVAEGRLVSDVSSVQRGNELEDSTLCLVDREEADTDVLNEMKDNIRDSKTSVNTSQFLGLSEGSLAKAKSIEDAALKYKKSVSQFLLSCDYQVNRDMNCHSSSSNLGFQFCNPGSSLDHVDCARILQSYNLQVPSKKEVNVNMSWSSSAIESPLLSHKTERHDGDHSKSLQSLSDSEEKPRDGDMKLFGKIITIPSSTQKPNLSSKGKKENCIHHPKLSSASSSLKLTNHDNAGEKLTLLKAGHDDFRVTENGPIMSYSNGNTIHPGFSSLPDSAVLLAKYPAAFNSYPTHAKDQRINGFEAISSLQQQSKEMVETNGVGNPAILVGGSKSAASNLVTDIKMQHFNSDQFVGQTGKAMKEDES